MKKRGVLIAATALCAVWVALGLKNGLTVRNYEIRTAKLGAPLRIALVSDLHSCRYGEGAETLIAAVAAQQPDIIALTGDIFDDKLPDDNAAAFVRAAAQICPCFYVTGNHEYWSGSDNFARKMEILRECGVARLSGAAETVMVRGQTLRLIGIDDPVAGRGVARQLESLRGEPQDGVYTILLSHRPETMEAYAAFGADLVLCGHAHGGQWRVPGLINGMFAPNQGWFPRFAGGKYAAGNSTVIVSRGLSRESTRVPRFYNPPELVMIDLKGEESGF